jgi:hypothetical protein
MLSIQRIFDFGIVIVASSTFSVVNGQLAQKVFIAIVAHPNLIDAGGANVCTLSKEVFASLNVLLGDALEHRVPCARTEE